jgi:ribosomal protein L11 methyltransferase
VTPDQPLPPHPATHRAVVPADRATTEAVAARLWARGALGLWERSGEVIAWFPAPVPLATPTDPEPLGGQLRAVQWSLEQDRDWQAEWKATIEPVRAGRTVIVPTWLADAHVPQDGDLTILLDPGRAFGSGHHATTTLCLEVLDELDLAGRMGGRHLADVGCGSGILAIAGAARGAAAVGVDIDADAVAATRENADRNGVAVDVRHGSVEVLPCPADIVVANLVTDVVAQLAVPLVRASTDLVIASGITVERQGVAIDALTDAGLRIDDRRERDGWIVLVGQVAAEPDGRAAAGDA